MKETYHVTEEFDSNELEKVLNSLPADAKVVQILVMHIANCKVVYTTSGKKNMAI